MTLRQLKTQLDKDLKEICREHNKSPIEVFVEVFERRGIFKRWEELWGDSRTTMAQRILQHLKEDLKRRAKASKVDVPTITDGKKRKQRAMRFILNIAGLYQGLNTRIWVIASAAAVNDLKRFNAEKIDDIQGQLDLVDQWMEEIEERTGESMPRVSMRISSLLDDARRALRQLPGNGSNGQPPGLKP